MSDLVKEIAKTVVRIKTEMRKASARPKNHDSQDDLFEDEGGRRYSLSYRRSKEKELREKRKRGGPKVMGKAQFASRSEAGRYAANMRWKGQGQATLVGSELPGTPGSANFSRVMAITAPKLFGGNLEEVDESTFEEAQMKIEGFVDQLREVGIENLGEKEFKQKFGSEVDSIKDTLHEMKWQSRRSMPTGPLNRAKGLQEEVAAAASKLEFTPRDRMRADAVLQAYEEQIQSLGRAGSRITEPQSRSQIDAIERRDGGRQVLEAKTRERALGVIAELDRQATKEMRRADNFRFKATGADAPRFNAMASNSEAKMYNLQSQYGGAVEVFEALFDEQLES